MDLNSDKASIAQKLIKSPHCHVAARSFLEYFNAVTRTSRLRQNYFTAQEAQTQIQLYHQLFQDRILIEKSKTYLKASSLAAESGKTKKWHIFDCMLAAIALDHKIKTIYTENTTDFTDLPIKSINPF